MITDVAEALVEKLGITEKVNSEGKKVSAYDQAINMVYSRGYKIYTTQNPKYQKIAEDVCYNLENIPAAIRTPPVSRWRISCRSP